MVVQVKVIDSMGNQLSNFRAKGDTSIASQANNAQADIPLACCAGACLVCACNIKEGGEYIQKEKFGHQLAHIESNQICSCISGIDEQLINDSKEHTIIIQKLF